MTSSVNDTNLKEIIEHENEHWSKIFKSEKKQKNKKTYSSYWWEDYYKNITNYIRLKIEANSDVLELGSGSGKATFLLGDSYNKTLLDISPPALDYAKNLAKRLNVKNVKYINGNAFKTKLASRKYDLVWNIGVIEHYNKILATDYIYEMVRLTKDNGHIAVAVPNFKSVHIRKAKLLNSKWLSWVPGYRLDSENDYSEEDVRSFLKSAIKKNKRNAYKTEVFRVGNPLPMGTPEIILKLFGRPINYIFRNRRFLLIVIVKLGSRKND